MRTALLILIAVGATAHAEPTGKHPRILLDSQLRDAWREQARLPHGPVKGAIALCDEARTTKEHDHALYQGSEWAKTLQACLVAWAATEDDHHAQTAIKFMTALLDDRDMLGDHLGGDESARRDDGYAIRNLAPYTAIAYDWLHDRLPPELRERARHRWKAWLDWYQAKGYRAHAPGSNYNAGYVLSATLVAIAEAGDAGADGTALWNEVESKIWKQELATALSDDGVLAGGDWPEGWQYGPLAVAELSLGARAMRQQGVDIPGVARWLDSLLRHHVYALSPGGGMYAGGDTETEAANVPPHVLELDAIALGDASPDDKRWARGELSRLQLADNDFLLYDALAGVGDKPVLPPRAAWPTWYLAQGTGTLFARTRWDDQAVWFVTTCHAGIDLDHRHADAGNFVLSRGKDDVIVDPSPYGSQSTLTSNAPTVASAQFPKDYIPSQASWSEKTGFDFATQRKSGVIAARCDYSDQYKFQDRRSDVPDAFRDLVVLPGAEGKDAIVIVVDRANTGGDSRDMYLRFRTPGHLALSGEVGTATVGGTQLTIAPIVKTSGKAAIGVPSQKDCYKEGTVRGQCDAARFPVTDYRLELAGPRPFAAHVLTAIDARAQAPAVMPLSGDGWQGAHVRDATVVWRTGIGASKGKLAYRAPPGRHVVLDAPDKAGMATVTAKRDGDACVVEVTPGGSLPARPLIVELDAQCDVTLDPEAPAASAAGTRPAGAAGHRVHSRPAGCCGAQTTPGSPIAMAFVVGALAWRRRRAPSRASRRASRAPRSSP
ncbi:MAG: hypothetical protein ACM31C_15420 [Acidobacteriota bacterium]